VALGDFERFSYQKITFQVIISCGAQNSQAHDFD